MGLSASACLQIRGHCYNLNPIWAPIRSLRIGKSISPDAKIPLMNSADIPSQRLSAESIAAGTVPGLDPGVLNIVGPNPLDPLTTKFGLYAAGGGPRWMQFVFQD